MTFIHELESQEAVEGGSVTLRCELSKPGGPVEWRRGTEVIGSGQKYQMKQVGSTVELKISDLKPEDSGAYVCDCGDNKSSASIKVNGTIISLPPDRTSLIVIVTYYVKRWQFVFLCLLCVLAKSC